MYTVLLAESNPDIMEIDSMALMMEGYIVKKAATAEECLALLAKENIDIAVLDMVLSNESGTGLREKLRQQQNLPVIFLSALMENRNVVTALWENKTCYLAETDDCNVLIAQVGAGLRMVQAEKMLFRCGKLTFDTAVRKCFCNNQDLHLTQKEFSLLMLLARNMGRCVSRESVSEIIWGRQQTGDNAKLSLFISRINSKLATRNTGLNIKSKFGQGFEMEEL